MAGGVAEAGADERFEERVVDLEEAAGAEAVALRADGALLLARVLVAERGRERDAAVAGDGLELRRPFGQVVFVASERP